MPAPEYNEADWKAAGRITPLAITALSKAKSEATSVIRRLEDLTDRRADALDSEDPATATAALLPSLYRFRESDLPRLDAAIQNLVVQRQALAPVLDTLLGDYQPPAPEGTP